MNEAVLVIHGPDFEKSMVALVSGVYWEILREIESVRDIQRNPGLEPGTRTRNLHVLGVSRAMVPLHQSRYVPHELNIIYMQSQ